MSAQQFVKRSRIAAPAARVFAWHERAGAFERLQPPWEHVQIVRREGTIREGDRLSVRTTVNGIPTTMVAEHRDYLPGQQFRDVQVRGPFARWEHLHRFEPVDERTCEMVDQIDYELPGGPLGQALGGHYAVHRLERMFAYRHRILERDMSMADQSTEPRTVAITGASGLIGSHLSALLSTQGHRVMPMVRREAGQDEIAWSPSEQQLDKQALAEVDVVVNLAGEPLFGRWNEQKKRAIHDSRVQGTQLIARTLAELQDGRQRVLINASGMNYYGSRGDELLNEQSEPGQGFLAEVCRDWEQATGPAQQAGVRVVCLRTGMVLTPRGGALAQMLPIFRVGGGGRVGDGKMWWSWVSIEDVIRAILHAISDERVSGPVNLCAPNPVRNAEFTKTLGRVLGRPTFLPVPKSAVRVAFGEVADEALFASIRMVPGALSESGYDFVHTDLELALRELLGRG